MIHAKVAEEGPKGGKVVVAVVSFALGYLVTGEAVDDLGRAHPLFASSSNGSSRGSPAASPIR